MFEWAAVVLAAGQGERMNSALPKVLHPVCGKEMLRHVLDAIRQAHDGPVVLVVAPDSELAHQRLGDGIEYVIQERSSSGKPLGTGNALLQTEKLLQGRASNVLVMGGDTPLVRPQTLGRLMATHKRAAAAATLLTSTLVPPDTLGRVVREKNGTCRILRIVEERDATESEKAIHEVNGGMYCFAGAWLWPALHELSPSPSGEYYLTDLIEMASSAERTVSGVESVEEMEILGVNNRVQLAEAERAMRERILKELMMAGVTVVDPATTYVDAGVIVGRDTTIYPNTTLSGRTIIGERCVVGPNALIYDTQIGDDCRIVASMLEGAWLDASVDVGPFSHLRPGAVIERDVHIGNFAEVKNSRLGRGTKMGHFSYMGDAELGQDVNVGAGTITCNYDGAEKNSTVVGDHVFLGCDTMLVAPIKVGEESVTGAGSVVNRNVPPHTKAIGVPARFSPVKEKKQTENS